jgi:hypothetical protein
MELSPSWEATTRFTHLKISKHFTETEVQYRVHKSAPLVTSLSKNIRAIAVIE